MFTKIKNFIKESYNEMIHHVTWSKYDELQSSSVLVLIASFIFALLIGLIDTVFKYGLDLFYGSF
ncbi:preprotein translocase subunit SecE [Flammeovirgaceae bacterium SG7u.111]|nr:preprotein translocase subunit SecE [Flammeovirgaceae bacterium SG7u.132]WPO34714.1 preprotein translocase subunit SecE [Flammeovirgaceae bacterium SG7u.111]